MRSLPVVSLLLAFAFCVGAAPPLYAQDPAAVQTEINAMETRQKEITSALDFFQSLIKGLDQGTLLMISDPNGHFTAPVSKPVAEGYLEAQVALGKMKADTKTKKMTEFQALTAQMRKEARQTVTELEQSQEKTKGLLSYLYTERARLKESPPAALTTPFQATHPDEHWAGTWSDGATTLTLSGEGESLTGNGLWTGNPGQHSDHTLFGFKRTGPHTLVGTDKTVYEDGDKILDIPTSVEMTLSGDEITAVFTNSEDATVKSWKPGVAHYALFDWTKKGYSATAHWKRKP